MAEDIIEAREMMLDMEPQRVLHQPILFDHKAFQKDHPNLKVADYAMDEAALRDWALRSSAIRAMFKTKSEEALAEQQI